MNRATPQEPGFMVQAEPLIRNISDTALFAAVYRARETERPEVVFRDPLARRLAGKRGDQIADSKLRYPFTSSRSKVAYTAPIEMLRPVRSSISRRTIFLALIVMITVLVLIDVKVCTIPVPWWYQFGFLTLGPLTVLIAPAIVGVVAPGDTQPAK